ncbi:uncharacterized protein LOC123549471 [Mercenaria mercenaria]|uniref:uncharacterized protein LOC123549471 n=1 Tax=Mercenaria mercenaria TaxID=6596 RepID=UPI00234F35F0|nr:uncharacterized protein LOC123549471 [Mercenaria mercenaria]
MECICNEIKEKTCVDYGNEEIQDIMKAVDILMNRFVGEFSEKYPDIKIDRLALCGSMAEKTRIWCSEDKCDLEFDYLAIVKSLQSYGDYMFEHNAYGQVEVKYKGTDSESVSGEHVNLSSNIKLTFINNFHKCITEKCERNWCTLSLKKGRGFPVIPELDGCSFCSVRMQTGSLICSYIPVYSAFRRLRFLWKSKHKSLSTSYVEGSDLKKVLETAKSAKVINHFIGDGDIDTTDIDDFLPQIYWRDKNVSGMIWIEVDFNPVIELDRTKVVQKTRMIRVSYENIILFPRALYREHIFYRSMYGTNYNIIDYVLKLIRIKNKWKLKVTPDLRNDEKYFLFPKYIGDFRKCWRLSTYQTEMNILNEASKEHRLAYCVLKFLFIVLKMGLGVLDRLYIPIISNYEAKLAVIQHIKHCKTPNIGAHVCVLNILHGIALCKEGSASVDHPVLKLDLYEMLKTNVHKSFERTLSTIRLKILILILVNRRSDYTVTDLCNDAISSYLYSNIISIQYRNITWSSRETRFLQFKESLTELHSLVTRRKEHASKGELIKSISVFAKA